MNLRLFLIGAIVLIVFAIIGTASSGTCLGVAWTTWLCAAVLSYLVDLLTGWGVSNRTTP